MARYRFWRCPDCGGKFKWLHHPSDAPPPDRCQLCGAWMSDAEPVFVPQAPAVSNPARVKAVDDVYYGMEDASKLRAEQMAAMTPGASASDFRHTHITDLRDRQRPGDIAAKAPPPSPVSQAIAAGVGGFNGGAGMLPQYAHIPLSGDAARQGVGANHWQRVQQIVSSPIGVYKP